MSWVGALVIVVAVYLAANFALRRFGLFSSALSSESLRELIARREEPPLVRVAGHDHVTYRKGALAMYLVQVRLGEDAVNPRRGPPLVAHRFTVITTLSRSVPILERNLVEIGLAARCARVRASDIAVLALRARG